MVVSRNDARPHARIYVDGQLIELVSRFTYQGQFSTEDSKCQEELKCGKGQVRSVFNNLKTVFCCRKLPLPSRIRLLKCYVWSSLLYHVETWTLSKISKKRLEVREMWASAD